MMVFSQYCRAIGAVALGILLVVGVAHATPAHASAARVDPATNAIVAKSRAILDQALTARNPDIRKAAVRALGLIGPHEPYESRLMVMLRDPDVQVREAAIASLIDLRDPATLPALRRAYDDPVPEVSFAAAKALHALGDATGRDALIGVLQGGDDAASGYVSRNARTIARFYYTPKATIPFLVARAIGMAHVAGLGAGIAAMEGILSDQNVPGRASAALLLEGDRDPRVLPALKSALGDKNPQVRMAAVHALALRDDPALEADLIPLLDDKKGGKGGVDVLAAAACLRMELIAAGIQKADPLPNQRRKSVTGSR
ncbi:MAG: HEAT repeat domain-containing protein [Proteobacteria bacterium]|nr:HEAT repeat domain-containing protein [Pseudomonadota bacterium]